MSLNYLWFGSYWRNVTSPLTHWHRGTAVQIDTMKVYPEMQVVVGELGTDLVMLTMAARITQSVFTLARNFLQRRPLGLKIVPCDWKSKAFQAVLWMCWNMVDVLLAVEVTNMFFYKNMSKHSTHCHTRQSMNTISIKCHWGCTAEIKQNMTPGKELCFPRMENPQENTDMVEGCDHTVFSDMDIIVRKEPLLPSCTNSLILSMIYVPSEDGGSSLSSEDSDLSEFESDDERDSEFESDGKLNSELYGDHLLPCEESSLSDSEDEETERDSTHEDSSVDSGMQESWTPKSKEDMDDSEEESDWLDEEDDSWDAGSDADDSRDDDLWASFCRNDPYNPLSFAMPTRSSKQQVKNEGLIASSEKHQISAKCDIPNALQLKNNTPKCTKRSQARKPVLSSFKSSHKCASQKKSESMEELNQIENPGIKKVRFSSNVLVRRMVTWNYAYRMARKGPWEEYARDRSRFQKRIAETKAAIGFCLEPCHRQKIWAARHYEEN
ncbi:uncharacterized protein [Pyxicephalus adspersus]|uniref:Protein phosphatase 1 regulatory subunit 15A n=1 Tax=Pyxicephalus adspersus TaxID=30357 RepID=A0AAV2ZGH4_PYXAD|nr:TPA: hypothetical protein GDO54_003414 [Pyxicephalus adspersus]